MWNKHVARAELIRIAADLVSENRLHEEAEELCWRAFRGGYADEEAFRRDLFTVLEWTPDMVDRACATVHARGHRWIKVRWEIKQKELEHAAKKSAVGK